MLDDYLLLTTQLTTMWSVMDPLGHVPLFLAATAGMEAGARRKVAVIAVPIAYGLLVAFGFLGQIILHAMGVSLLSFQIAGGTILFLFAISMVLGAPAKVVPADGQLLSIAIYPVATPIIAGPGSLLTIVLLLDNQREVPSGQIVTLLALGVICLALLLSFLLSNLIYKVIGEGGANLLRRVMGLILAALAVNMILSAAALWLHLPPI
jgi:multiple antibiotic resistance protein